MAKNQPREPAAEFVFSLRPFNGSRRSQTGYWCPESEVPVTYQRTLYRVQIYKDAQALAAKLGPGGSPRTRPSKHRVTSSSLWQRRTQPVPFPFQGEGIAPRCRCSPCARRSLVPRKLQKPNVSSQSSLNFLCSGTPLYAFVAPRFIHRHLRHRVCARQNRPAAPLASMSGCSAFRRRQD